MVNTEIPILVETSQVEQLRQNADLFIIDLSDKSVYLQGHIADAIHLEYSQIVQYQPPIMGLLPSESQLTALFSSIGLTPEHHVVAYDCEGGGKASRLLWTLAIAGHQKLSLLNGGLQAWQSEQRALSSETKQSTPSQYQIQFHNQDMIANRDYILTHLNEPTIKLLDARSSAEYSGADVRALRGGHIPGAVNFDWLNGIDQQNALRLKPKQTLLNQLSDVGITPDCEVIVYCQTHTRSAFSFIMLKALGFDKVRGYPGSWSDWGNQQDTPIES